MSISISPSTSAPSSAPSSPSTRPSKAFPTAAYPTFTGKRPTPADHIFNYTYTYGYNFGYIANSVALIEASPSSVSSGLKQRNATLSPTLTNSTASSSSSSTPSLSGSSTLASPASTATSPLPTSSSSKLSVTYASNNHTAKTKDGNPLGVSVQDINTTPSVHPFSPYYKTYIELVSSGGLNTNNKAITSWTNGTPATSNGRSGSPLASRKRKHLSEDTSIPTPRAGHFIDDHGDTFSLPTFLENTSDKAAKRSKLDHGRGSISSPSKSTISTPSTMSYSTSTPLSPSSSSLGNPTDLPFPLLSLPSLETSTSTSSSSTSTGPSSSSDGPSTTSRPSRTMGSSPLVLDGLDLSSSCSAEMAGIEGIGGIGMRSFDFGERDSTPGVFTSSGGIGQGSGSARSRNYRTPHPKGHGPSSSAGSHGEVKGHRTPHHVYGVLGMSNGVPAPPQRPRGLWRARNTGPSTPNQLTLNTNVKTGTTTSGTSTPTAMQDTSAERRAIVRRRKTPCQDGLSCGEGYGSCCSGGSSSGKAAEQGVKRRRRGRTDEGSDGYSSSGTATSWSCSSGSENEDEQTMKKSKKRQRQEDESTHHGRRHPDHGVGDEQQQQQQMQSRLRLLSPSTTASGARRTMDLDWVPSMAVDTTPDDVLPTTDTTPTEAETDKYQTRSKVMDISSLACTLLSESNPAAASPYLPPTAVTYEDWEDLKEVWSRCLEGIDVENPADVLPLLRGVIHECSRFLQAHEDPSILFLSPLPSVKPQNLASTVNVAVGANDVLPSLIATSTSTQHPPHHPHSKDPPTAFHALLGTALFFFGNLINAAPHLALPGEPTSRVFYHLYALDIFEMGESLPARTGSGGLAYGGYGEELTNADGGFTGSGPFGFQPSNGFNTAAQVQAAAVAVAAHRDCCGLGAKEDWRMAITWGRTLISLAEELLAREKICEDIAESQDATRADDFSYFALGKSREPSVKPNPASFLSEDLVLANGGGYFSGTGGRGMGFNVDGMGVLRVGNTGADGSSVQLPSAVFPLSATEAPKNMGPTAVSSPFSHMSLDSKTSSRSPLHLHSPSDDPRRSWKKDSPFVIIRSRMPPVTRRMTLGATSLATSEPPAAVAASKIVQSLSAIGGAQSFGNNSNPELHGSGPYGNSLGDIGAFSMSWWNDTEDENKGQSLTDGAASDSVSGQFKKTSKMLKRDAEIEEKKRERRKQGATVDMLMTLAMDQFSRGILHMPRTGSGGSGHLHGGGAKSGRRRHGRHHHHHHHKHGHRHNHHHRGDTPSASDSAMDGTSRRSSSKGAGPQPFSRASHLLTIAIEVLMLAEKLSSAESRYRWASYADSVFEQLRLEESPGANVVGGGPKFGEENYDMDVDDEDDIEVVGEDEHRGRERRNRRLERVKEKERLHNESKQAAKSHIHRHHHAHHTHSHSHSRPPAPEANPLFLDSNNNSVILKARGRCDLIIGSAIAEEKVEAWFEELESGEDSESEDQEGTPVGDTSTGVQLPRPKATNDAPTSPTLEPRSQNRLQELLKTEDAEEARGRLREAVHLLERAREKWRGDVSDRQRERQRIREDVERERERRRRAARAAAKAATSPPRPVAPKGVLRVAPAAASSSSRDKNMARTPLPVVTTGPNPAKRRGIGALAAESKKRRREQEKAAVVPPAKDAMRVFDHRDDARKADVDVEMGDTSNTPPETSTPSAFQDKRQSSSLADASAEEADARLLAMFDAEQAEEEEEEMEFARLIAEALVTLANILLVVDGDEAAEGGEGVTEADREELYRKAKEEMRRGGVEEVDEII